MVFVYALIILGVIFEVLKQRASREIPHVCDTGCEDPSFCCYVTHDFEKVK